MDVEEPPAPVEAPPLQRGIQETGATVVWTPLPRIRETTSPAGPSASSSLLTGMSSRSSGHCLFAAVARPLKTYLPLVGADPEVAGSPGSRLDVEPPESRQERRIETVQSSRGTVMTKPADMFLPQGEVHGKPDS